MSLNDLVDNWDDLTNERRLRALQKLIDLIASDFDKHETLAFDLIAQAEMWESEEYFGTEGLDV